MLEMIREMTNVTETLDLCVDKDCHRKVLSNRERTSESKPKPQFEETDGKNTDMDIFVLYRTIHEP